VSGNSSTDIHVGWVRVVAAADTAYPTGVLIFSFKPADVVMTEAAVPAVPTSSTFRLYVERDSGLRTGFAIANPGPTSAQVTYDLTDMNGIPVGHATAVIASNNQVSMFIDELMAVSASFQGVLRISTAAPDIAVVGLRGRYNERGDFLISTAPPFDEKSTSPSAGLFFPHFVQSGGYTTQFVLFSTGSSSSTGNLLFFTQAGQPMNLP
jgi:hypothetical protein